MSAMNVFRRGLRLSLRKPGSVCAAGLGRKNSKAFYSLYSLINSISVTISH
jgi:hypothetical protein